MPKTKVAVTIDDDVARELDRLVAAGRYANRSKIVQTALRELLRGGKQARLAAECAKLDAGEEQALAEEFAGAESWPEY